MGVAVTCDTDNRCCDTVGIVVTQSKPLSDKQQSVTSRLYMKIPTTVGVDTVMTLGVDAM